MTRIQTAALVTLRMVVGWHICYEGLAKLLDPYWSSAGYLASAQWWVRDLFNSPRAPRPSRSSTR